MAEILSEPMKGISPQIQASPRTQGRMNEKNSVPGDSIVNLHDLEEKDVYAWDFVLIGYVKVTDPRTRP